MNNPRLVDLSALTEALGPEGVARFVRSFISLWPTRCRRIHGAISAGDLGDALDAVLSLHSGASMAGAQPLAAQTELIRKALVAPGSPAWGEAHDLLAALDDLGERTVGMLRDSIAGWPR